MDESDFFKAMKSANNWNWASAVFLGSSIALLAIEAKWIPNNLFFDLPSLSYLYCIIAACVCKLEAANYHRVIMINELRARQLQ